MASKLVILLAVACVVASFGCGMATEPKSLSQYTLFDLAAVFNINSAANQYTACTTCSPTTEASIAFLQEAAYNNCRANCFVKSVCCQINYTCKGKQDDGKRKQLLKQMNKVEKEVERQSKASDDNNEAFKLSDILPEQKDE
ncbi:uncharacterized protein [Amphiura filiformis]|uniref:uncharacterized protein n=1 Tax=Amphiura filiformis TaxID=82378 RepID=UPI003B21E6E5